jgi:exodeoxyribonuclease-3
MDVTTFMSVNLCVEGPARRDLSPWIHAIRSVGADVVALQEVFDDYEVCESNFLGLRLAEALGWNVSDPDPEAHTCVLTRYPILRSQRTKTKAGWGACVDLGDGKTIQVFSVHLSDELYGPERIEKGEVKDESESIRESEIARGEAVSDLLLQSSKSNSPVVVAGDFNEPSFRDWSTDACERGECPFPVAWPSTSRLESSGFTDCCYPPGSSTWPSPGWKDTCGIRRSDRLDFIFARAASPFAVGTFFHNPDPCSDHGFPWARLEMFFDLKETRF